MSDNVRLAFEKMMREKCPKYTLGRFGASYVESGVETAWNGFREGYQAAIAASPIADGVERRDVLEEAANIARAEQSRQLSLRGNNELDEAWETHNYGAVVSANIYDGIRALASPTTGAQKPCPQEVK